MDLDMPVMNGFDAAQNLKDHDATRDIPIVAVTAADFCCGDLRRFLFHGYVQKPLTAKRLMETVQRLIGPPGSR
jgi:CheY-like chemotaxis protein